MSSGAAVQHISGTAGGYLVGRRHANHGIKAINKATGQPIELEGGEAVITRRALSDKTLHSFDGKKLTQREILSLINENAGGVAFEKGGEVGRHDTCMCSGNKHTYNGRQMSDMEVFAAMAAKGGQIACGCDHAKKRSNSYFPHKHLPGRSYETGGELPEDLTEPEKKALRLFRANPQGYISLHGYDTSDFPNLLLHNIVFVTGRTGSGDIDIFITDTGRKMVKRTIMKEGGEVPKGKAGKMAMKSDKPATDYQFFKGLDYQYPNPFQLNKAIEEFLDKKSNDNFSSSELQFIRYYSGYGGLEKLGAEGVGLLYEYYTPDIIIQRMWGLAYKHGYKGGSVLEPSCGTGEFLKYLPLQVDATGYEISKYSARISKLLYPNVNIENKYFEELFIKGRDTIRSKITGLKKYDLIIGNPPYGNFQGKFAGMGEKSYTKANNYIDYFILRGLDLLKPGGLLVYIIGAEVAAGGIPFLDQDINPIKKEIANKAELLDAYRLPNGVFDRTDVLSDIIVLGKK